MPDHIPPSRASDRRPAARTVEREFRAALKRLGLSADAEDFDLALAGYGRVMQEIAAVRRHLSDLRTGASGSRSDGETAA